MSVIWYKVWFDLWWNKVRTILAVLSIAAGVFAVGTIFGLVDQLLVRTSSHSLNQIDVIYEKTKDLYENLHMHMNIFINGATPRTGNVLTASSALLLVCCWFWLL